MKVKSEVVVQVKYGEYEETGPNLICLNWLQQIHLDWKALGVATVRDTTVLIRNTEGARRDILKWTNYNERF